MNFLSQLIQYFHGLYSSFSKREIWPNLKRSKISKNSKAMPTKTGLHALGIDLYWHKTFEPIPFDYFLTTMDYSSLSERGFWPFLKAEEKEQNL